MPAPKHRRRPAEVRHHEILVAAASVLTEQGLQATTMADVAARAGLAKGTVYLYFASKDELLSGLRAAYLDRFTEAVAPTDAAGPAAGIAHLLGALYSFAAENVALHHLLFHEAGFSERDAFSSLRARLAALVAEGAESGDFEVDDAKLTASFLLHGIHGVLTEALHSPGPAPPESVANQVGDLVKRSLAPWRG